MPSGWQAGYIVLHLRKQPCMFNNFGSSCASLWTKGISALYKWIQKVLNKIPKKESMRLGVKDKGWKKEENIGDRLDSNTFCIYMTVK